jgi:hypothetical protein
MVFRSLHDCCIGALGVKSGSRSTCNGVIIILSYIATYHLIQKLLSETSTLTLYNDTTSFILLIKGKMG